MDDRLSELESQLSVLLEYVRQRVCDTGREGLSDEYLAMVTPPYERELIAAKRVIELSSLVYRDVGNWTV